MAYDLELTPDLDQAEFAGQVSIAATVVEPTAVVVLNAIELSIASATITAADGQAQQATCSLDSDLERLTLTVANQLEVGPVVIDIHFKGILNDKLRGFYRSTYEDDDGVTQTIATTQFESTDARRAFPCWDEPDLKATFDVSLVVPDNLLAISSGPEVNRETLDAGLARVRFGTTMKMSTYLLAFIVGPLVATEPIDVDGVPLRVVHAPGKEHLTEFALEVGAFSLRHFTSYFDIAYPDQKLDLVGLPDFASGAMENLGCVTFREPLLMLDVEKSTKAEQQRAADVIAHEIAHMWFGDLVTMTWWNGIWLKEAFATFCEMHATNAMRPDWQRWEDFGLSRSTAFNVDSLVATRPIEFDVVSPADADAMYDVLTYEKGAAVVRMLEQYLGEDAFRGGIRDYLREHSYGNTDTHDLWDSLEGATGQPARQIMDSWIFQGGYPLVSIERSSPTSVTLRQQRFGYRTDVEPTQWSIPIVLAAGADGGERVRHRVLLDTETLEVDLDMTFDWIVGNADANGFYRVKLLGTLQSDLNASLPELSALERYSLVDDAWAAFVADQLPTPDLLSLVATLAGIEEDTSVWKRLVAIMTSIDDHLEGPAQQRHRDTALGQILSRLDSIGPQPVDGELEQTAELRGVLFGAGGRLGDASLSAQALSLIDTPADPARTAAAVQVVATNGGAAEFEDFVQRYENAATPQDERRFLFALPLFQQPAETEALLQLLDADRIRAQDASYVLGVALANDSAVERVWEYVSSNWESIQAKYPDNSIPRMIGGAQSIGRRNVATAISDFFNTHELPQAGLTLDQHLERMWVTVELRERLRSGS